MKEIDFIPEWYKANQTRRKRYHRQYLLLTAMLTVMMVWSFVIGRHVEKVRADVEEIQSVFEKGKLKVNEGMSLEAAIAALQHQGQIVEAAAPRTPVSAVIAELSWLIRDNIVLSKLEFKNEAIEPDKGQPSVSGGVVLIDDSPAKNSAASSLSLAPERTRVILTGIAARAADAAALISRLEESNYFEQVSPSYTKAKKVKDYDVTEFEIRMVVADYKTQK